MPLCTLCSKDKLPRTSNIYRFRIPTSQTTDQSKLAATFVQRMRMTGEVYKKTQQLMTPISSPGYCHYSKFHFKNFHSIKTFFFFTPNRKILQTPTIAQHNIYNIHFFLPSKNNILKLQLPDYRPRRHCCNYEYNPSNV